MTSVHELRQRWLSTSNLTTTKPSSWYQIVNAAKSTELYVYDEIGGWGVSSADFAADLRKLDARSIDLHINSPGGAASDGVAIYNALLAHPASVTTIVDGWAASAASVIAMAGDRIEMREGSLMMIHKASGLCYGNDDDMAEMTGVLRKVTGSIADIYTSRRGGKREDWLAAMAAETWYTRDEAVKAGLADQEAEDDQTTTEPENSFDAASFAAILKGAFTS